MGQTIPAAVFVSGLGLRTHFAGCWTTGFGMLCDSLACEEERIRSRLPGAAPKARRRTRDGRPVQLGVHRPALALGRVGSQGPRGLPLVQVQSLLGWCLNAELLNCEQTDQGCVCTCLSITENQGFASELKRRTSRFSLLREGEKSRLAVQSPCDLPTSWLPASQPAHTQTASQGDTISRLCEWEPWPRGHMRC